MFNKKTNNTIKILLSVILLLTIIFTYSVKIRKPWYGQLADGNHQWVTGHTLLIVKQWYLESPMKFNFELPLNPPSIEFPTIKDRGIYFSFPSGFVLPIYIISQIKNHIPSAAMIMRYNLINQLLTTILLFLISYLLLKKNTISGWKNIILSFFISTLVIFLPGPFYWFQNTYFSQEAVIVPYCLIILLEIIKNKKQKYLFTTITESIVLFCAFWTDWLSFFIALTLFVNNSIMALKKKKIKGKIKRIMTQNLYIIIPCVMFISIFLLQTYSLDGLGTLGSRFIHRVSNLSLDNGENTTFTTLDFIKNYTKYIKTAFGYTGIALLIILTTTFLTSIFKKKHLDSENQLLANLILIPNLIEIITFKNHSYIHNFTTLKLLIPIVLSIPLCVSLIKKEFNINSLNLNLNIPLSYVKKKITIKFPLLLLLVMFLAYKAAATENKFHFFLKPNYFNQKITDFISENTNYNEVVFSPNYQIPLMPPQKLSLSLKRVYLIENISNINNYIKNIDSDDLTIDLLVLSEYFSYEQLNYLKENSIKFTETEIPCDTEDKEAMISELNDTEFKEHTNQIKSIDSISNWNNKIYLFKFKPGQINSLDQINTYEIDLKKSISYETNQF